MTTSGAERPPASPPEKPRNPLVWLLIAPVTVYRTVISPWLPRTCRYYPSCSTYAIGALRRHGFFKGLTLAVWRILRCNPWSLGGVDMVPEVGRWRPEPYHRPHEEHQAGDGEGRGAVNGPRTT
ncbi:membrane protein insertion efficiency factor YidD [Bogoriella caseilytica]|uniref:Putative membrane protein insertion efficiency factor n=1 Tax=Bogoriella caseilytica TaxID=56055 RepID=A0A3N2BCZ3_9MICO|nr:hypothetical protein EDD31_1298 [Bogoriella caseilytica]